MTNDDLHELTAAYALDALDGEERKAYEAHLRDCAACRAELASLARTVGALAFASEGPPPPGDLRSRIVSAAHAEPPNVVALRPRRTLYAATALAAAAAVGLAIGLWAAISGGSSSPRLALALQPSGTAQLTTSGFDRAPAGKVYEIWVIEEGAAPKPAGVFRADGQTSLTRPVPKGATVAVTLERAPRARTPTPPILAQTEAA